jgi:hypothetical protein
MFASCSWLVSLSFSAIHHAYYAHIMDGVRLELAFGVWFLGVLPCYGHQNLRYPKSASTGFGLIAVLSE